MDIWVEAPPDLELDDTTIDIWRISLDICAAHHIGMLARLSEEELARAKRFHFERDRHRYISCRGALREILGGYLNLDANALSFSYTRYGKPGLSGAASRVGLNFNLSHSNATAVIAVSRYRRLGIDLEFPRLNIDMAVLARRYFSKREAEGLVSLTGDSLVAAFFRVWTRKEAYIKARGDGLSLPLQQFDVSLDPEKAQLLETRHDPGECDRWTMQTIPMEEGGHCTLVAERPPYHIRRWRFRFPTA